MSAWMDRDPKATNRGKGDTVKDNLKTPAITDLTGKYPEDALGKLTPAKVKSFKADKGFGTFDTPKGDVFFYANRYVALKIDTENLTQAWETPCDAEGNVVVRTPAVGDACLIRMCQDRNGRNVADLWTYQKQVQEQTASLAAALKSVIAFTAALPILELELISVVEGQPYADNKTRTWVTPRDETRRTLFKGNNYSAMLDVIGEHAKKAKTQRLYLAVYNCSTGRERVQLPTCKHLEYPAA